MLLGDSGSVWSALAPYASAPDHELAPSPPLDTALHALVAVLQGVSAPPAVLAAASRSLAAASRDGVLAARAADVRGVAQRAEGELERAYAEIILRRLVSEAAGEVTPLVDVGVPREGWPGGAPPPAVVALAAASRPFPYVDHYVRLVAAEAAALSAVQAIRSYPGNEAGTTRGLRLAFCGSGPLPLTGCLLAAAGAAASVTLIDIDPSAVAVSSRLLDVWAAAGALRRSSVTVLCADATRVAFAADPESESGRPAPPDTVAQVAADVVFVAALLPTAAKTAIATRMAAVASTGSPAAAAPVIAVRTAHGLTADLTYEVSGRATLSRLLPFVGVVVPRTHEAPVAAAVPGGGGVRGEDPCEVLGWFPSEILNSMELYGGGVGGVHALRTAARTALAKLPY